MENIVITLPKKESTKKLIISFLKEIKVSFQITSSEDSLEELQKIVEDGRAEYANGETRDISIEELDNILQS